MRQRYKRSIEAFCEQQGIVVPAGFHRLAASRYAAVDLASDPPTLVAKTWLNKESLIYFLENLPEASQVRVLDFHDHRQMDYDGLNLQRGEHF